MAIDLSAYQGREQALVKHTFLERYMRDQLPKVARFGTFAYVDLFAGPWQSKTPDFSDTSFGIALRQMSQTKAALAKIGVNVRMTAHLVEKENYDELKRAVSTFSDVEVICYPGTAEANAPRIADAIPPSAFRFVVIDPKGLPDPRQFESLIAAPRTEVLLNFMFQFANRFVATERMPQLVSWLGTVAPGPDWQTQIDQLTGSDRENHITNMARTALAKMGGFNFAPAITVDEAETNRTLYKLIYLTRHQLGLKIFRDAQVKALEVQAGQRTKRQAEKRLAKTNQHNMFASAGLADTGERSAMVLSTGRREAETVAFQYIKGAGRDGIQWKKLWTQVLDETVITHKELGDIVAGWKKAGRIEIRGLLPPARKPKDEHLITASEL